MLIFIKQISYLQCYLHRVPVEDLLAWENKYGENPRNVEVIMNSGWSEKYRVRRASLVLRIKPTRQLFTFLLGTKMRSHAPSLFVSVRSTLLAWTQLPWTTVSQKLYLFIPTWGKNNIVGIENVANLDNITESGSTVLNIEDGSGSPARVFATYDDEPKKTNTAAMSTCFTSPLILLVTVLMCMILN